MVTTRKTPKKATSKGESAQAALPEFRSRDERLAAGIALRDSVPRKSHAAWKPPAKRRDPIEILEESNQGRLPQLIPIRYGRMVRSPFTFLRGSAGLMAYDLATTPTTGLRVQACGDGHLLNFGLFATPERNLVFDINDFDETLPAPWEWDVKRLAVSFAVAARDNRHSDQAARDAAIKCVRAYREHLREDSKRSPLEIWYERLDMQTLIERAPDAQARKLAEATAAKARQRIGEYLLPKISTQTGGRRRLVDQPPVLFHIPESDASRKEQEEMVSEGMEAYRQSLQPSVRVLFDRYRLEDWAVKVVGIGSGDPLHGRPVLLVGRPSAAAAIQGGPAFGPGALCGQEPL